MGFIARWKGRWPICPRPYASSIGYVLGAEFGVLQSPTIDNPVIADEWHTRLAAPVLLGVFFNLGCSGVDAGYVMYRSGQTNLRGILLSDRAIGARGDKDWEVVVMLTRRGFSSFAACAICGITEFIATEASAEGNQPAPTPGVTRKILSQMDGPAPGYVTLLVDATIEPGVMVARHTHPGIESAYVLEGGFEVPIQGQPTRTIKPGDGFQIPPETPHAGGKPGETKTRILITYVVEKGKPLASPA